MKKFKYTCIVGTSYALSVYLLKMDIHEVEHTFFICGSNIHPSVVDQLPNAYRIKDTSHLDNDNKELLKLFLRKYFYWPFIFSSELFAQDHAIYLSQIIGSQQYTLIPDGPGVFNMIDKISGLKPFPYGENVTGFHKRFKYWLLKRPASGKYWGTNDLCINRWITSIDDVSSPYLKGKKITLLDYAKMWKSSSALKKIMLKKIYSLNDDIIKALENAEVILFTQPFMTDCGLSEQEQYCLYRDAIREYRGETILIKPHPRDKFDYDRYFPDCVILHTYAPQQLLNAIGCSPKVVITVCSTAVSEMPDSTDKIFLGTKVHPAIYAVYGDQCN